MENVKNIYMIGIGGISMSGIAEILHNWGYNVSGSDTTDNDMVESLRENGITVNIGQVKENIDDSIDLVIYTAAINEENEELKEAKRLGIKTLTRGNFLGEMTKMFKHTIGVSGTHGKTSTSSMLSLIFLEAGLDPTIQIGSTLSNLDNKNYRVGSKDNFIIESCEYKNSFLSFHEESAIVLNIDDDHLDYFGNIDNIVASFKKYVSHLSKFLVTNISDERCLRLKDATNAQIINVGSSSDADYHYENINFDDDGNVSYDAYKYKELLGRINLYVTGSHNVFNSLCALAMGMSYGIDFATIKSALTKFRGAARRMEYKGIFMGAKVYDDYGHHPTEIKATVEGIMNKKFKESWVIFEAHTYTRYEAHIHEFAESLTPFDHIILIDIYAAREENIHNVSVRTLERELRDKYKKDAIYISDYEEIKSYLNKHVHENDLILTLGAGNVTKIANLLTK